VNHRRLRGGEPGGGGDGGGGGFRLLRTGGHDLHAPDIAAIELSHRLDLTVVAEGVETDEQYGCLEELGCDLIQGYLISRPVPAATLNELMTRGFDRRPQAA
jgi:hypothetical protein